jgi:O-antigen/teichoic acid export membrane protein
MLNPQESLTEKFVNRGKWMYIFVMLTGPLGYLVRIMLTGDLTPAEVGILYSAIGLLSLMWAYTDLGLTESLGYFLPRYIVRGDYARCKLLLIVTLGVQILSSLIVWALLYFWADFLSVHYFKAPAAKEVLEILSLFFFGTHLLSVNSSLYSATQNVKLWKWIEFFRMMMTVILIAIVFFGDLGHLREYTWAWIGWVYSAIILSSAQIYRYYYIPYFRGIPLKNDTDLMKTFFKYSIGTLLTANVWTVLHQIDQQAITYFIGVSEAGIYAMYLSLVGIPFIFMSPIIGFLFPVISELGERKQFDKIRTIHWFFSSYASMMMIWVAWFFIIFGPTVAIFLFGENYFNSWKALSFVAPFLILNILIQINFQILGWLWYVKKRIVILSWTLLANSITILSMIYLYLQWILLFPSGSSAASLSVGLSWIVLWYLSYRATREYHGRFLWNLIIRNIFFVIIWFCISLFIKESWFIHIYLYHSANIRIDAIIELGVAFLSGMIIFLLINLSSLRELKSTIESVKKISHSHS